MHSIFAILILPLNSFLTPVLHIYLSLDFRRKYAKLISMTLSGNAHCCIARRDSTKSDNVYYNVNDGAGN